VPGHWEGDLILGANSRSAVGTLVERSSRLVLLLHINGDRSAVAVDAAMRKAITTLPRELKKSITWDQGAEMSKHASFTIATGIPIYFCDPHSPWQKGSNENTNGLLRQYLPKGTDLTTITASDLRSIQRSLNERPRKTLGYLTPIREVRTVRCSHRLNPPSSPHGPSAASSKTPALPPRWVPSALPATMPWSSRSGAACRSSS
jgi:IS30 family transposase